MRAFYREARKERKENLFNLAALAGFAVQMYGSESRDSSVLQGAIAK